jgi:hypothetical protein
VEGWATAQEKEDAADNVRAGSVGAPAALGIKNEGNGTLDKLAYYQGVALRWEQLSG